MKHTVHGAVIASLIAAALGACGPEGVVAFDDAPPACRGLTTCEACTPVPGCGFCYESDGTGRCTSNPRECASADAFYWTWNPSGCRVYADAGVAPSLVDGSAPPSPTDAPSAGEGSSPVDARSSD